MLTRLPLFVMACAAVAVACASEPPLQSQLQTSQGLAGTWSLISRVDRTSAGQQLPEPSLGDDPIALLIYDTAGHVSAQLMRRDRSQPGVEQPVVSSSNNSAAAGGYDAYFGTYYVDSAAGTVTHRMEAAVVPEDVGKSVTRHFELRADTLRLWFETSSANGQPVTRTLIWIRVG